MGVASVSENKSSQKFMFVYCNYVQLYFTLKLLKLHTISIAYTNLVIIVTMTIAS